MLLPALLLFILFLLLSAFFSSTETAFVASNPYTLDYLDKKGSKRARLIKHMLAKVDTLLAAILIGNTLANVAAASVATYIFVSFFPNKNQAVLLATVATTLLLLFFAEINPKTYAAYNPLKVAFLFVYPVKIIVIIFYPFIKTFTFLSALVFRSSRKENDSISRSLNEEEIKILLTTGIKGLSSPRTKMISGIMDIGTRPVKEIMVPRPQVKAIELGSSLEHVLEVILS